jgi:hypothetical protein
MLYLAIAGAVQVWGFLLRYIETNMDSLRIPVDRDYEIEYFKNNKQQKPPYFTSGYFNEDTLTDYAMVLIKDSTMHYVFSFHTFNDTYKSYLLYYGHFSSEYNSNKIYAVFDIESNTERIVEGIDTVYNLKTDIISVSNIYESRTGSKVWNEKKQEYEELYFD